VAVSQTLTSNRKSPAQFFILLVLAASAAFASSAPLSPDFQRGVCYAHIHSRGHGYGSQASAEELTSLKKLGVTWISITPFAYQSEATASSIVGYGPQDAIGEYDRSDLTMTDEDIVDEIRSAHSLGIKVTLKPHLWSSDFWDAREWHGTIRQNSAQDHAQWWACYRALALHYARFAERSQIDMFCIGTELVQMTTTFPEEWKTLIGEIRKTYHGPLTYAAHWDGEFEKIPFWDALDYIGLTAYFPLDAPEGANVEELVSAWQPYRKRIAECQARFQRPVIFLESGYRTVAGAHQKPWLYHGGRRDFEAQARAYEALFQAFHDLPWWKGNYFWKAFTDPHLMDPEGDGMEFCFEGHPAQTVLKKWYRK